MKIVINNCYGGFGLSPKALSILEVESEYSLERTNPALIECVETLGVEANGSYADLKIVEIPDDIDYIIEEYDGIEHVAEKHRTWY